MKDIRWYYNEEFSSRSENFLCSVTGKHALPSDTVSTPAIDSQVRYQNKKALKLINCQTRETN